MKTVRVLIECFFESFLLTFLILVVAFGAAWYMKFLHVSYQAAPLFNINL